jgi:hypothetical protein
MPAQGERGEYLLKAYPQPGMPFLFLTGSGRYA